MHDDSPTTDPDGQGLRRPRARLIDADGHEEDVTHDERLVGLNEFFDSWERDAEIPDSLRYSCWQNVDDKHPIGGGEAGYRIAYKTLRWIPYPNINLTWPNLRVSFHCGSLTRGGPVIARTVPGRSPRHLVLPERGILLHDELRARYLPCPDLSIELSGETESLQAISYVEIIWHVEDVDVNDYDAVIARGRRAIGPIKTTLDLKFGPRLLAMPLTEEVGEIFPDGHWIRRDSSPPFTVESQTRVRQLQTGDIVNDLWPIFEAQQAVSESERKRAALASMWYWRADAEPDVVVRYISWWVAVESLEMKGSDPGPVRKRLSRIIENDQGFWGHLVGKLWRLRGDLVHGDSSEVPSTSLKHVETLARVLLASRLLGQVSDELRANMLAAATEMRMQT